MSTLPTPVPTLSTAIQTYKRLNWANGGAPSISAENLNKSDIALFNLLNDQGYIKDIIDTINNEIDARKSDILTVNTAVTNEETKRKERDSNLNSHIEAHEDDRSNPHYVTKEQVGLSLVDNKSAETLKSEFTGSISFDNPGFVKGGEAYQELQNLETELKSYADQITPKNVTDLINDASYTTTEAVLMECYTKAQTQDEIQNAIKEIDFPETDLSNYYTKSQTDTQIETAIQSSIPPEVDLSNYYTKSEVDTNAILRDDEVRLYCGDSTTLISN